MLISLCREEGSTLIVVTHDPALAGWMDAVCRLTAGRIVSSEDPA